MNVREYFRKLLCDYLSKRSEAARATIEDFGSYELQSIIYNWKEKNYLHWLFFNSIVSRKIWGSKFGDYIKQWNIFNGKFKEKPISFWEWYFLNTKPAKATRQRKKAVIDLLVKLIDEMKMDCNILDVGSGNGEIVITAFKQLNNPHSKIHATCIDKCEKALETGRSILKTEGMANKIDFVEVNMWDFPKYSNLYEIIILSGITCPMDDHGMEIVLKKYKKMLKAGGYIILTNVSRRIISLVPLLIEFCSQKSIIGEKKLQYKSPKKVKQIMEKAGYKVIKSIEVGGYHTIAIGKKA